MSATSRLKVMRTFGRLLRHAKALNPSLSASSHPYTQAHAYTLADGETTDEVDANRERDGERGVIFSCVSPSLSVSSQRLSSDTVHLIHSLIEISERETQHETRMVRIFTIRFMITIPCYCNIKSNSITATITKRVAGIIIT